MKPKSKRLARPAITPFGEDEYSAGAARVFVELDVEPGPGVHVSVDLKVTRVPAPARLVSCGRRTGAFVHCPLG